MVVRIQLRRDTQLNWTAIDPVLAIGEPGVEYDTGRMKIGDGYSLWSELKYTSGPGDWSSLENKPMIPRDIKDLTDINGILKGLADNLDGGGATSVYSIADGIIDGVTAASVYDLDKGAFDGGGA